MKQQTEAEQKIMAFITDAQAVMAQLPDEYQWFLKQLARIMIRRGWVKHEIG